MQLVVMVAVLAMAGAGAGCSFDCHLANIAIRVESCGVTEVIETTECTGQCHNRDPNYVGRENLAKQKICNGDWSYEEKHINGCPVAVTYPVASNCRCTLCEEENTSCSTFHAYTPGCNTY